MLLSINKKISIYVLFSFNPPGGGGEEVKNLGNAMILGVFGNEGF